MRLAWVLMVACGGAAPAPVPAAKVAPAAPEAAPPAPDRVALADPCEGGEVTGDPDAGGERGIGKVGTRGAGGGAGYGSKPAGNKPNVSDGTPQVMGGLAREVIQKVIKDNAPAIRHCYEKLIVTHDLEGRVQAKWTIKTDGTVVDVTATGVHPDLERCLTALIGTWKFPSPPGGGIVKISYPFVFKKQAQ